MFRLNDILGQGYEAHVMRYRSENRTQDALDALTLDDPDVAVETPIIHDLLAGDIAAQAQAVYTGNQALSILQTFDDGVLRIDEILANMQSIVGEVKMAVYSDQEVAQFQIQFEDKAVVLNRVACETSEGGYKLLCSTESPITVYVGNNHSVDLPAADLRFSTEGLDFAKNIQGADQQVRLAQMQVGAYHQSLHVEMDAMVNQVRLADTRVAETMGYGLNEPNVDVAQALAQEVVEGIMTASVVALEGQSNIERQRMPHLLGMPLYKASTPEYQR